MRGRMARWMCTAAMSIVALACASACGVPDSFRTISDRGASIRNLFDILLIISALVFLLVAVLLVYMLIRFRERPGAAEPSQTEGSRKLEIAWTVAPVLLLTGVFVITARTLIHVHAAPAGDPVRIEVVGHQWWWEFRYPDLGIVTANELHVPVGESLHFEITGADVIHSFWVPRFGWKMDAIPGKTNEMVLTVDRAGTYDGACTEYCGAEHAWMRIRVVAEPRDVFDVWVRGQQQPAGPAQGAAADGQRVFLGNTCQNCHAIRGTPANGAVGPDLTHFGSRATIGAGVVPNTPDNLRDWIRHAGAVKPGVLMPPFNLSDSDLQALVTYLEGLK
jgi:cytochrome c oxidase subunit 2